MCVCFVEGFSVHSRLVFSAPPSKVSSCTFSPACSCTTCNRNHLLDKERVARGLGADLLVDIKHTVDGTESANQGSSSRRILDCRKRGLIL